MQITLVDIGKKYNRNWIFRNINCAIEPGDKVAITGHNGSGKSTLLKIIGGYLAPTQGHILRSGKIDKGDFQINYSFAAPYLNLIEEFTLIELLSFHARFKHPLLSIPDMIEKSGLQHAENKHISEFSSGMKQRLRLVMAFFFSSNLILLDEPTSNLDTQGSTWYTELVENHTNGRILIIASNQPEEYTGSNKNIHIENFQTFRQ